MVRGEVPIDPVNQNGAEFVAEAFRDGLEVDARHHGLSGEEMAQVMETNTIKLDPRARQKGFRTSRSPGCCGRRAEAKGRDIRTRGRSARASHADALQVRD